MTFAGLIFVVHANGESCSVPSYKSLLYEAQASQVNISRGAVNRRFKFGVVT
jgi:hypothetical protein